MDLRASLNAVQKRKIKIPAPAGNGTSAVQPVAIPTELSRLIQIKNIQNLNFVDEDREDLLIG
jgi:hypothetical protein